MSRRSEISGATILSIIKEHSRIIEFIETYSMEEFRHQVYEEHIFNNVAFDFIHPNKEIRELPLFNQIQSAFINAYV